MRISSCYKVAYGNWCSRFTRTLNTLGQTFLICWITLGELKFVISAIGKIKKRKKDEGYLNHYFQMYQQATIKNETVLLKLKYHFIYLWIS